jgi:ATP/ADP translocase
MTAKQYIGFKIWTAVLSVFVAVMLFPNIVGRRGIWISLLITALAVGAIWLMYFTISRFIEWEVFKELKRKGRASSEDKTQEKK